MQVGHNRIGGGDLFGTAVGSPARADFKVDIIFTVLKNLSRCRWIPIGGARLAATVWMSPKAMAFLRLLLLPPADGAVNNFLAARSTAGKQSRLA